jgi:hypothetical protein
VAHVLAKVDGAEEGNTARVGVLFKLVDVDDWFSLTLPHHHFIVSVLMPCFLNGLL